MVWAGVTAWLSAIVMCFTVGPHWSNYLQATSSYVVSIAEGVFLRWPLTDRLPGLVHGCAGLVVRRRDLVRCYHDGVERELPGALHYQVEPS